MIAGSAAGIPGGHLSVDKALVVAASIPWVAAGYSTVWEPATAYIIGSRAAAATTPATRVRFSQGHYIPPRQRYSTERGPD